MNLKRVCGLCLVVFLGIFTSACFTIEKEIFLNPDGSGELVLHVSMPDLPESAKGDLAASPQNPFSEFDKFRKEVMTKLPPTVKLKEAKQVKQNGVVNFFAVLEFKDLKDTEKIFTDLSELGDSAIPKAGGPGPGQEWTSSLVKQGDRSTYTERFYFDVGKMSETKTGADVKTTVKPPPPAKSSPRTRGGRRTTTEKGTVKGAVKPAETPVGFTLYGAGSPQGQVSGEVKMEGMEQLEAMMLSLVRLRFVLHAPSPITESNADMVLNSRIAVWNCSLLNFTKEKKPIELKAVY